MGKYAWFLRWNFFLCVQYIYIEFKHFQIFFSVHIAYNYYILWKEKCNMCLMQVNHGLGISPAGLSNHHSIEKNLQVTVDDPTTCQLFCRIYADCQMWTFDEGIQGENCFLINMVWESVKNRLYRRHWRTFFIKTICLYCMCQSTDSKEIFIKKREKKIYFFFSFPLKGLRGRVKA